MTSALEPAVQDCSHHRPETAPVTESVLPPDDRVRSHDTTFGVFRYWRVGPGPAGNPARSRSYHLGLIAIKTALAQSLKKLIQHQMGMQDNPPRRASRL